jgi:selenocysteine lyase/cysteine desulfurase
VDAAALGADAVLMEQGHWLLGPEGVAALWVTSDQISATAAALCDRPGRRALLAIARSVGWLLMYGGLPWLCERTGLLTRALVAELAAIPGVEVLTPPTALAAMVCFRIAGWEAGEAADELGRRVFAILGRPDRDDDPSAALRASVGAWNTGEELARFARAVADLASHTPETLPRRPTLVVLGPDEPVRE